MNAAKLKESILQAQRSGWVKLITRDKRGVPFVEHFGRIDLLTEMHVALRGWFFPKTLYNLHDNKELCIIIWDTGAKKGFELLGRLVMIDDLAHANGRLSNDTLRIPQSKKQMVVAIKKLIELDQDNYLLLTEEASLLR